MLERILSLLAVSTLVLGTVGCPKQAATTDSGEAEAAPVAKLRFSGDTRSFVDALMTNGIVGYDVADGGASVVYDTVDLSEAGAYTAATTLRLGDEEPFACVESGSWALDGDAAQDATAAMVTFSLDTTNCPGRTAPKSWRAKLEISGSDVLVSQF